MRSRKDTEFSFDGERASNPADLHHRSSSNGAASDAKKMMGEEHVPLEKDPTAIVFKGPGRPQSGTTSGSTGTSSFHPRTALNSRKEVEQQINRQKREQRAVGSLLQGAAAGLLTIIVICIALAGFGGWVLWKEINHQSATISLLETNMRQQVGDLRTELLAADEKLIEQQSAAGVKMIALTAQVEQQRDLIGNLNKTVEEQAAKLKQQADQLAKLRRRSE